MSSKFNKEKALNQLEAMDFQGNNQHNLNLKLMKAKEKEEGS